MVEDTASDTTNTRESRIEKLPLTFPGNVSRTDSKEPDKNLLEKLEGKQKQDEALSEKISTLSESKTDLSEKQPDLPDDRSDLSEKQPDLTESLDLSETNQSDTISDSNGTGETNTTDDLSEISPTDDLSESNTDNLSDTVSSETSQSDRRARNFDTVETTETTVDKTEKYELLDLTSVDAPRTRAPPKFVPKIPKSSYFPKPRVFQSYSANHLDIVGIRKFKSNCTCQKIWNCPKLQITVPRCPDEYFLCCI